MKKVVEISLGGIGFTIEEDAYHLLKNYLTRFEKTMVNEREKIEVMEDVEARIAEIFQKERKYEQQIIDVKLVRTAIGYLGEIEDEPTENVKQEFTFDKGTAKRFYRDVDNQKIGGVCSGISAYFNIDVTLVRIVFVVALLCYGSTFILYVILWIVTNPAVTVAQKLELRGIPPTAENIKKYSVQYNYK